MARNGYIIASVEHNDNIYTLQSLINRPYQISKTLDLVLNDTQVKNSIDKKKIGMVGHSLGGYTAFVIAGGVPDFSNHSSLCLLVLNDKYLCTSRVMMALKKIYEHKRV